MSAPTSDSPVTVRTRFAPSPTGLPHSGNIRTALFTWLLARSTGGTFILRVEDTDQNRFVPGAIEEMMRALRWLGIDWDEGPDKGGAFGPYRQSERLPMYQAAARQLIDKGAAYKCFCTPERLEKLRETQTERGLPTGYDRRCRYLSQEDRERYERENAPYTVRFAAPREGSIGFHDLVFGDVTWECRLLEDAILLKSSGWPTYHLAVIVDDHAMEITHVIRGEEWLPSAPMHLLTYKAFDWQPPQFAHTTSILGKNGKKLSKRDASAEFLNFERDGYLPEAMFNFLALVGWTPPNPRDIYTRDEIIDQFGIDGLVGHPAIFDAEKLLWYNGVYIRALDRGDLADRCLPFLVSAGLAPKQLSAELRTYIGDVIALEQERVKTLAEAPVLADFFLLPDDEYVFDEKAVNKWLKSPGAGDRLEAVRSGIAELETATPENTEAIVRAVIERFEVKNGDVIHPVRVAVTGRTTGPGLFESMAVFGKNRLLNRLNRAIAMIG